MRYKGEHGLKIKLRCLDNRSNVFNFTLSQTHISYCVVLSWQFLSLKDILQTPKADNERKFLLFLY